MPVIQVFSMTAKGIFRRRRSSKSLHRDNCREMRDQYFNLLLNQAPLVMKGKPNFLGSLYSLDAKNDMPQ